MFLSISEKLSSSDLRAHGEKLYHTFGSPFHYILSPFHDTSHSVHVRPVFQNEEAPGKRIVAAAAAVGAAAAAAAKVAAAVAAAMAVGREKPEVRRLGLHVCR